MDLDLDLSPLPAKRRPARVGFVRELAVEDIALECAPPAAVTPEKLRDRHHALARCLASGMSHTEAAVITGYSMGRISVLLASPDFRGLVEHYREGVTAIYGDLHGRMANLALEAAAELGDRLEEDPGSLRNVELLNILTAAADRTGHGPSAKLQVSKLTLTPSDIAKLLPEELVEVVPTRLPQELLQESPREARPGTITDEAKPEEAVPTLPPSAAKQGARDAETGEAVEVGGAGGEPLAAGAAEGIASSGEGI